MMYTYIYSALRGNPQETKVTAAPKSNMTNECILLGILTEVGTI